MNLVMDGKCIIALLLIIINILIQIISFFVFSVHCTIIQNAKAIPR